jgi:hypothetical protein
VNSTKHALVAELTQALAPLLPPTGPAAPTLPKSVAHALEQLAESLLRWRTRQARATRGVSPAPPARSESAALAQLLTGRLEEADSPSA